MGYALSLSHICWSISLFLSLSVQQDACCYGDGCDIQMAVYDDSNGVGWGVSGWINSADDSVWGGGVIYDHCPCNDGDVNCENGERQVCMSWGEAFTDENELAA